MKINMFVFCLAILMLCSASKFSFGQSVATVPELSTKTLDINKDGKADVTHYHDGKNVTKAEADTNYDGKPDITVYTENGKFKSAEVDTDYDGTPDKKFSSSSEFNKWLNENHPDFNDSLAWSDKTYTLFKF